MSEWRDFWNLIKKSALKKVKRFKVDIDGLPYHAVKRICQHMIESLGSEKVDLVEICVSDKNPFHFHVNVVLSNPIPAHLAVIARILMFDDIKRVRCDLVRWGRGKFHLSDYLGNAKYRREGDKAQKVAGYKPVAYWFYDKWSETELVEKLKPFKGVISASDVGILDDVWEFKACRGCEIPQISKFACNRCWSLYLYLRKRLLECFGDRLDIVSSPWGRR